MPEYVFFLGNHPQLSYLELKQVLGKRCDLNEPLSPLSLCVAKCKEALDDALFDRLGGCERVAVILGRQDKPWDAESLLALLDPLPRKWMLGAAVSESFAFEIKKAAQQQGSKVKFVLPKGKHEILNAAQVIFNKLDRPPNAELIMFQMGSEHYAVKTIWIQDIRAYEIRDTARPARHGKIGMLPPKLAQVMINLAVGNRDSARILDPFCGMGTVLQEGQLMGYEMTGSDVSPEMVEASKANLAWLALYFNVSADPTPKVFQHDAVQPFPKNMGGFDAVVTEPDLGPPLRAPLSHLEITKRQNQLGALYRKAFANFLQVLKPGGRVVFVFPAFASQRGRDFVFMPDDLLDGIAKLGYRRVHPFGYQDRLFYARPDAWVGRDLTIWEKKYGT